MPTIRRKIEVHRLTISGLSEDTPYGGFLRRVRRRVPAVADAVFRYGTRSHLLHDVRLVNRRLRMRFISYTTGHRPDILDTEEFSIAPNPLSDSQTGIEWTHVLGGLIGDRYVVLIERFMAGIWPSTIERYLQWLIDEYYEVESEQDDEEEAEPITVSIEAEPGEEFIERLDELTRVTKATVRRVRPNPGWGDLEVELAGEAQASDAHRAEVTMTARRNASLRRTEGIIAAIRRLFGVGQLDYAAVEGQRGSTRERFNTEQLGRFHYVALEIDERGQVVHDDGWEKLNETMDDLE